MKMNNRLIPALLVIIAICLFKLAFFSSESSNVSGIIPQAHAQSGGSILEWNNSLRLVTSGDNGATTYVWDFKGKTSCRKYTIKGKKLELEVFDLED